MKNAEGHSPHPGLCASCKNARRVGGRRSDFWFCELSGRDPAYPRYPRLPVIRCGGYEPGEPAQHVT